MIWTIIIILASLLVGYVVGYMVAISAVNRDLRSWGRIIIRSPRDKNWYVARITDDE